MIEEEVENYSLEEIINCCYILNEHHHCLEEEQILIKNLLNNNKQHQNLFKDFQLTINNQNKPIVQDIDPLAENINNNELINEKDLKKINNLINSTNLFKKIVNRNKNQENLQFLIEIYNYELLWNQCFKDQRSSILKCKTGTNYSTNDLTINNNKENKPIFKNSIFNSRSSSIFEKLSSIKDSFDINSIVDLKFYNNNQLKVDKTNQDLVNSWDYEFDKREIGSNSNSNKNNTELVIFKDVDPFNNKNNEKNNENNKNNNDKLTQLSANWKNLMKNYIYFDSPFQINLSQEILNTILKDDKNPLIIYHSPIVLYYAKNSILQLLNDNIYSQYLRQFKDNLSISSDLDIFSNFEKSTNRTSISNKKNSLISTKKLLRNENSFDTELLKNLNEKRFSYVIRSKTDYDVHKIDERKHSSMIFNNNKSINYKAPCGIKPTESSYVPKPTSSLKLTKWMKKKLKIGN